MTDPRPPRVNVELISEEEQQLIHEARVVSAALGEPLRDLVIRAMRAELARQRRETPDLLEALDRLRAKSRLAPPPGP